MRCLYDEVLPVYDRKTRKMTESRLRCYSEAEPDSLFCYNHRVIEEDDRTSEEESVKRLGLEPYE